MVRIIRTFHNTLTYNNYKPYEFVFMLVNKKKFGEYRHYYYNRVVYKISNYILGFNHGRFVRYYETTFNKKPLIKYRLNYIMKKNLDDNVYIDSDYISLKSGTFLLYDNGIFMNRNNKLYYLSHKYYYIDGKLNGIQLEFHENNNIKIKCFCVNNKVNGEFIKYHDNQNIEYLLNYENNCIKGEQKYFDRSGDLILDVICKNNTFEYKSVKYNFFNATIEDFNYTLLTYKHSFYVI